MRRTEITLTIPNPCGENFKDFKHTVKGGFCSSCNKEVIDFTKYTDKELTAFFKTNIDGVCGRFLPGQLRTYADSRTVNKPKASMIAAALGLLSTFSNKEARAAQMKPDLIQVELTFANADQEVLNIKKDSISTISGRVVEENDNSGIAGATVLIKGTKHGTTTDPNGNFNLSIKQASENVTLVISFIGYQQQELTVQLTEQTVNVGSIRMPIEVIVLGGVCVRRWTPRGIWFSIKGLFKK